MFEEVKRTFGKIDINGEPETIRTFKDEIDKITGTVLLVNKPLA